MHLPPATTLSIGIFAWNEEKCIGATLDSLFRQSIFEHFSRTQQRCEIICVANGCTDRTFPIAREVFDKQSFAHPFADAFLCRLVHLPTLGKLNAVNTFLHELSASQARALVLMDADIVFLSVETLRNMLAALDEHPEASVSTDRPLKDILFKRRKNLRDRISLATSRMTRNSPGQLSAQLYCLRASAGRKIYFPRDLPANEDGYVKTLLCTDFLTGPQQPHRIVLARNASHIFRAYLSPADVLRNQTRQMLGQTVLHILLDKYLKHMPACVKHDLPAFLREKDLHDPAWLKRLIAAHLRRTGRFWRLFPDLLSFRFQRLARINTLTRPLYLLSACTGFLFTLAACWHARRLLNQGSTRYWPGKHFFTRPAGLVTTGYRRELPPVTK